MLWDHVTILKEQSTFVNRRLKEVDTSLLASIRRAHGNLSIRYGRRANGKLAGERDDRNRMTPREAKRRQFRKNQPTFDGSEIEASMYFFLLLQISNLFLF